MRRIATTALAGLLAALIGGPASQAAPAPQPYQADDGLGFFNILPPGQNGLDNAADTAAFGASGARPPHNDDQLAMYGDLVYASPGLRREDVEKYFKDASFGVKAGETERTYSPRADVTIVRDSFGVPHIYGDTRAGAMFGSGYAQAEDRLFFMDVLRHVGRAEGASFLGGASRQFDHEVWLQAPYKEEELTRELELFDDRFGPEAAQIQEDVRSYVEGANQYVAEAKLDPTKMPAEYAAINRPQGPDPFVPADAVVSGIVFGAILGVGGGRELDSALVLQDARRRFGRRGGERVWRDFLFADDPEAPTTVHPPKRFPYQLRPRRPARGSVALPDPGSVKRLPAVSGAEPGAGPSSGGGAAASRFLPSLPFGRGAMSNALLISAGESESGRPLAVFGPQTGYFGPQPLIEIDLHAPGIDARGAAIAGTPYVVLGRGRDYAWSATSSGHDTADTFALELCEPDGKPPTLESMHYRFRGRCEPIEVLTKTNAWSPNLVDSTPAGEETLTAERTLMGIGTARATVGGKPVLYTKLRATYGHEVDRPALAVAAWNSPERIGDARDFQRSALNITYTFNWFYADDRSIAYIQGGANPVRARGVDPYLPVWGRERFEWRRFDPDARTFAETPPRAHPQVVDQQFITSWNNKPAHGFGDGDGHWGFGPVYRSQLLDDRVKRGIRGPEKLSLVEAIDAMEDAGSVDLRGDRVLPWMLRVLGRQGDPALAGAIAKLEAWRREGAHRRDRDRDGTYEHSEAVRIMDAWWPLWAKAQFEPVLGKELYDRIVGMLDNGIDNTPNGAGAHHGSAYQGGIYSHAQKDLRQLLRRRVRGRFSRAYCGGRPRTRMSRARQLARCRALMADTLRQALAADAAALYGDDGICEGQPPVGPSDPGRKARDQWCFDAIWHQQAAVVSQPLIHWINRPTFQQAVEVQGRRPR